MKARDDYEKFRLIGRAEGACLSAFASWHNRQPEQKQIRTDWLPSFHFLNFFASWFYGRHIGPIHATLIFLRHGHSREKISLMDDLRAENYFLGDWKHREMLKNWFKGHRRASHTVCYARLPGL